MPTAYVNDQPVEIGDARLNCIQAAGRAGVFIPHYCWHPSLTVVASCRMCLVEVGERKPDGTIVMQPRVVPGCQTPVKDGTVIVTAEYDKRPTGTPPLGYDPKYGTPGDRSKRAQADTLEGLLLNHPLDCPVCDKAGECLLQDFSYTYGRSTSRLKDDKRTPANKPEISSKITLFTDRCIMCSRCVRFTREVAGTSELTIINRGDHSEIDIFPGEPLENKLSGNVVDLCPVGALCSKDFLYKHRVWFLKESPSVCPNCSTGCSINIDSNKDVVYRLTPRENPAAQGWFMCDEGRWGFQYVNAHQRLKRPMVRAGSGPTVKPWSEIISELRSRLKEISRSGSVIAVLSPYLTVEEAYLMASFFKGLGNARLLMGPVPIVGDDDHFPKSRPGQLVPPIKFTIRAEKAPNRRGVASVLQHFEGRVESFHATTVGREVHAIWVTGGYPKQLPVFTPDHAQAIAKIPLVVVQDLFVTPLTEVAHYILPSGAWSEKDGVFVNHAGLAQSMSKAANSPGEARVEAQVFADLLGRTGLFRSNDLRSEIAGAIPALADLKSMNPLGVRLELPVFIGTTA